MKRKLQIQKPRNLTTGMKMPLEKLKTQKTSNQKAGKMTNHFKSRIQTHRSQTTGMRKMMANGSQNKSTTPHFLKPTPHSPSLTQLRASQSTFGRCRKALNTTTSTLVNPKTPHTPCPRIGRSDGTTKKQPWAPRTLKAAPICLRMRNHLSKRT